MTTRICEIDRRSGRTIRRHGAALRTLLAVELETLPRVAVKPEASASRGSLLDDVLSVLRHRDDAATPADDGARASRRYRFPRWTVRDRRIQRLRGWLGGAPG
ncbi:hypothetical protein [Amycolatopsis sp. NPDC051071]|uniref:hypothetical protein n=1 Tax=Amycolatopsis sp. NPDC051071 TaxID=3154637 RepID=UPI0034136458